MAHEGSKPVRKAKIDMLEGQLNRFIMFDNETPQDMFNRLKKLVNKPKALEPKKWTDRMLTEHMMRDYTPINYNVVALIHQDPTYKRMSSDDVLGRIMNHEIYIEEVNHVKNLSKGITTTRKKEIAFKANKKSKNKQEIVESSSGEEEEEEEEDSSECDDEDMTLFMKKSKKYIKKKKFAKGDKKLKITTNRTCYNCDNHGHFIANCPFERRDDGDDKKKYKPYKKDKGYKRSDKPYKKKSYGEAHVGQEWESEDESSNSDSDGMTTVAIKGKSSSNKSLFPKLNQEKHTCLMTKKNKHKVKTNGISSPKYVSNNDNDDSDDDDDAPFLNGLNEKRVIKNLENELVARDQLLEDQEDLLEQERKNTCELKTLLKLEKDKMRNLLKARRLSPVLRAQLVLFKTQYDVLQKTHKDVEVKFDAL
jgi:hypothetical protein